MGTRDTGSSAEIEKAMTSISPVDVATAESVLKETKEIMDQLGVVFFLRQGTCLGAIRDNAILAWDDDIDIGSVIGLHGLTNESVPGVVDRVIAAFSERGFSTRVEQTSGFLYVLLLKSSIRIDWECFHIKKGTIYHWPPKRFPVELFIDLLEIDFLGQKHHVPNPPEDYLTAKYGSEWRIPKPSGSYEKDVLNMIPDPPRVNGILRQLNKLWALLFPVQTSHLLVLDDQGKPVAGAEVHVAGVGLHQTNLHGRVSLKLTDDLYHSLTIRFNAHEEVLYIERLVRDQTYVYKPDPQQTSGRSFVLKDK